MGPARRVVSSISHPFELNYEDTVEEIRLCSQTVTDIANSAGRAELRDIHIKSVHPHSDTPILIAFYTKNSDF